MVIGGRAGGLDHEDVVAANILVDLNIDLAVGELGDQRVSNGDAEVAGNLARKLRIRVSGENHQISHGTILEVCFREACRVIGWGGRTRTSE